MSEEKNSEYIKGNGEMLRLLYDLLFDCYYGYFDCVLRKERKAYVIEMGKKINNFLDGKN